MRMCPSGRQSAFWLDEAALAPLAVFLIVALSVTTAAAPMVYLATTEGVGEATIAAYRVGYLPGADGWGDGDEVLTLQLVSGRALPQDELAVHVDRGGPVVRFVGAQLDAEGDSDEAWLSGGAVWQATLTLAPGDEGTLDVLRTRFLSDAIVYSERFFVAANDAGPSGDDGTEGAQGPGAGQDGAGGDDGAAGADGAAGDSDDGGAEEQVQVCHMPPGNPGNAHTIQVGASSVPAHLAHGDVEGPCPDAADADDQDDDEVEDQDDDEADDQAAAEDDDGDDAGSGQGAGNDKVTVCHKGNTIEVAQDAVDAHTGHGDTVGACAQD